MINLVLLFFICTQPDFSLYLSDDGLFSINSPGPFIEKYQELETEIGNVEVFTLLYEADIEDNPNYLYLINYYDYPSDLEDLKSDDFAKDLFDTSIQQSAEGLKGKLLYSSDIVLQQDYAGRINRISYNDGNAIAKSKMFFVGNRFYFLQVYTIKENSLNPEMDTFLNSFKVFPKS